MTERRPFNVDPIKLCVRMVQSQDRIRLAKADVENLTWLNATPGFSIACSARIGPARQLQILANEREADALQKLRTSLESKPPNIGEISASWIDFARYAATIWTIPVRFEPKNNRFTFVLPKEARALGIVPNEHEMVAIFSTGEILEIWKVDEWVSHVTRVSANLTHFAHLAMEAVDERSSES